MASWVEHAAEKLSAAGYRRGGARQRVLDLLEEQPCALSAIEIEDALRRTERAVARASIYRVLDELEKLKLVTKVEVGQGIARYEALRPDGAHHHHHLVCDLCGDVRPFADDDLEHAIHQAARRVDFAVGEHEIVLHGHCEDCGAAAGADAAADADAAR